MSAHHALIHYLAHSALRTRALDFCFPPITFGNITLLPHQVAAVHWLNHRINTHSGALLADPPGLGKTYVALAVAHRKGVRPLVIAPAALRNRWREAARETATTIDFVSAERLSAPASLAVSRPAFVIIDEAHHIRTPSTRRHQRTSALCHHAEVLLLTATPIHNHASDLEHITALFHLPSTHTSARILRQRLTLRRSLESIQIAGGNVSDAHAMPTVRLRHDLLTPIEESDLPRAIMSLPALLDADAEGHRLLQLGLLHALRSSDAAAGERIRRRIAVTLAIEHAARAHVAPTRSITRAFRPQLGDVQLAMPELLGVFDASLDPALEAAAVRQRTTLEEMLPLLTGNGDRARSRVLRRLARWCTWPVVAFTQFNSTARTFYRYLRHQPGIALLGGTTAHITSGVIPRHEVIERLLSPHHYGRHDAVRLLITSDVLCEGLSLAGVATIVHLDLPWTAARLDQRVGRAARIGAPVNVVNVVRLPAPLLPQLHEQLHRLVAQKRRHMAVVESDGDSDDALIRTLRTLATPIATNAARRQWLTLSSSRLNTAVTLAIVRIDQRRVLIAADHDGVRRTRLFDWQALIHATPAPHVRGNVAALRNALRARQADRELTATIADPRDPRYRMRRGSDHVLAETWSSSRAAEARGATVARLIMMHSTRRSGDNPFSEPQPSPRLREIRVLCGLTIVPAREATCVEERHSG